MRKKVTNLEITVVVSEGRDHFPFKSVHVLSGLEEVLVSADVYCTGRKGPSQMGMYYVCFSSELV